MRICFIVQRYSQNISGGAESHCKQLAERFAKNHEVSLLTTCASDYKTWANQLAPGESLEQGVRVFRFPVDFERPPHLFDACYDFLVHLYLWLKDPKAAFPDDVQGTDLRFLTPAFSRKLTFMMFPLFFLLRFLVERFWMKLQGPYSNQMLEYLKKNQNQYDTFIFFSYTYATTFFGLPKVAEKSILVPTAHNDPCLGFNIFQKLFKKTKAIIYQTPEEKKLVESVFLPAKKKITAIAAIGVDPLPNFPNKDLGKLFKIEKPYFLFLGRLEASKGCLQLLAFFEAYKKANPHSPYQLVMAGQNMMEAKEHRDVIFTGFVTEDEKWNLLQNCTLFIMPSPYESLSIVCLEAWMMEKPILVNGYCDVLRGQCERSGGGLSYADQSSFMLQLKELESSEALQKTLGQSGKKYVASNYTWVSVEEAYLGMMRRVLSS